MNEYRRDESLEGWSRWHGIFLPDPVVEAYAYEKLQELEESHPAQDEEGAGRDSGLGGMDDAPPAPPSSHAPDDDGLLVIEQSQVDVFEKRGVRRFADRDERDRAKELVQHLRRNAGHRTLTRIPGNWRDELNALAADFPNFAEVVDYLRVMFALANVSNGVPALAPMLFNGPPGIGKTYVADRIADLLQLPLVRVSMEVEQSNSTLCGSSEFWSNTKAGRVFQILVFGDVANPLFLLDEIDKVGGDERYDPVASLYALLERKTAGVFNDLAFPSLALNASRVNWILTSNDAGLLPEPILSRVRRFDIPAPTPAQSITLARKIFETLRRALLGWVAFDPLSDAVCDVLLQVSPREMERLLTEAVGWALYADRHYLVPDDIRLPPRKPGLGFIW